MGESLTALDSPRVAVIGGGCAGLAAAARLTEHNIHCTLYEASPHLGGRARGLNWKGQRLDNGQHILLGAYRDTLQLMRLAGVDIHQALVRIPLRLELHQRFNIEACRWLPAPLHILAGLISAKGLSWYERYKAIRFMAKLRFIGFRLKKDLPLAELLARESQPANVIRWLWEPICLAALNTPLKTASAQVFLNVLRDSFAKNKSDSDMLLPRQDLSTMLADPVASYLASHENSVRLGIAVQQIRRSDAGFELSLENGTETFSHVIIATSPFRLPALIEQLPQLAGAASLAKGLKYQPIYTVYLKYPDGTRLESAMLGFSDRLSQWVFDRGQFYGQQGLMAVVISAEGAHQSLTQEELAQAVAQEMAQHFPGLPTPEWHKVIAEKRATFACDVDVQRPQAITPVTGLYLAGDYVAGDYPSTIEGAVRCGHFCADQVIHQISKGAVS